jgi:hypothetical protein
MITGKIRGGSFSDYFDIESQNIDALIIKETYSKDNCYIYDDNKIIGGFILINKPSVKTLLKVSFYKSKVDDKYLPRLEFRKEDNDGELTKSRGNDVIIKFGDGCKALKSWSI